MRAEVPDEAPGSQVGVTSADERALDDDLSNETGLFVTSHVLSIKVLTDGLHDGTQGSRVLQFGSKFAAKSKITLKAVRSRTRSTRHS